MRGFLLIFLWAVLIPLSHASKEGVGYEMLAYYYAYKAEFKALTAAGDEDLRLLALDCEGSAGGLCTFNEFIEAVTEKTPNSLPRVTYQPGTDDGRHSVFPDVDVVGRKFQEYFNPTWAFTFDYIDNEKLHALLNPNSGPSRRGNELSKVIENLRKNYAVGPSTDLDKCLQASVKAGRARSIELEKYLLDLFQPEGGQPLAWENSKRQIYKITPMTKRAQYPDGGRVITVLDLKKTMEQSAIGSPNDKNEFKSFIEELKRGGEQLTRSQSFNDKVKEFSGHSGALDVWNNFVAELRASC